MEIKSCKLKAILEKHKKWLNGEESGKRANLSGMDLSGANLFKANLSGANLAGANLSKANLSKANLYFANLSKANLKGTRLTNADLTGATGLDSVIYDSETAFFVLQCPEKGSYTAFKKAGKKIVELLIPEDALRSSATSRKCRASKAKVISITSFDGKESFEAVASDYDPDFIYRVGETIEVKGFDTDRWNECAPGIHHFITRDEAVKYH